MSSPTAMPTVSASSRSRSTACASRRASYGARMRRRTSGCTSISGRAISSPGGERMGKNHPNVDPYVVSRVRALESLLLEKGLLAPDAVDRVIQRYENDTGPMIGARAVARAWTDPEYRALLLRDSRAALAPFGLDYEVLVVAEVSGGRR